MSCFESLPDGPYDRAEDEMMADDGEDPYEGDYLEDR